MDSESPMPRTEGGSKWENIAFRLVVSIAVWITVSAVSIHVAWRQAQESHYSRYEQWRTQITLHEIDRAVSEYRRMSNLLPVSLGQLQVLTNDQLPFGNDGSLIDGWQRPFRYQTDGTNWLVTSYGRDGQLGGEGLDYDLTSKDPNPKGAMPTFSQFIHDMRTGNMIPSCIICGGLAFLLSFFTVKLPKPEVRSYLAMALILGATLVGAIWVASIITLLHIPTGH
jgi:hypothetical protein